LFQKREPEVSKREKWMEDELERISEFQRPLVYDVVQVEERVPRIDVSYPKRRGVTVMLFVEGGR
jgi:hypothetical protein